MITLYRSQAQAPTIVTVGAHSMVPLQTLAAIIALYPLNPGLICLDTHCYAIQDNDHQHGGSQVPDIDHRHAEKVRSGMVTIFRRTVGHQTQRI